MKTKEDEKYDSEFMSEFNIGSRIWLLQNVEANGQIGMLNRRDNTAFIWSAGARFHSTDALSLGANVKDAGIYGPQVEMSVRFEF